MLALAVLRDLRPTHRRSLNQTGSIHVNQGLMFKTVTAPIAFHI